MSVSTMEEYLTRIIRAEEKIINLIKEYHGKRKGSLYYRKKLLLENEIGAFKKRYTEFGKKGTIVKVTGAAYMDVGSEAKLERQFEIIYTDIAESDAGYCAARDIKGKPIWLKVETYPCGHIKFT